LAIQHGIPFEEISQSFKHTRFEPAGFVDNPKIPTAESVVDYVIKYLESLYAEKDQKTLNFDGSPSKEVDLPNANGNGNGNGHSNGDDHEEVEITPKPRFKTMAVVKGISMGKYTECPSCGSSQLRQTGSCMACTDCGWSAGCG
jgi:ribonucleoside-diphosphate reductase alpha chain